MPYANIERQREYQRRWAANKKLQNKNGTINVSGNLVTWEQLQESTIELKEVRDWAGAVKKAKQFIAFRNVNRIAVARLAMTACIIKHGGNTRTFDARKLNLSIKAFSDDIGMHYKTLHNWISVTRVIESIPKTEEAISWTIANQVRATIGESNIDDKEKVIKAYTEFSGPTRRTAHAAYLMLRYLKNAAFIAERKTPTLTQRQTKLIVGYQKKINALIKH